MNPTSSSPAEIARRLALPGILLLAAVARFWDLGGRGFGTEYYAAAVRSMLSSPHNLLYNAFDPTGVLSIDKPPLAFWIQVLSAHLLGYSAFALMLPQAIEGCLSVLLVWHLVRRDFGFATAAFAAFFLAITPVSIAVDRSNNTDSLLVLVLLLAVWVFDKAEPRRLVAAMALVGVAFNVKMLAAFGALPGFAASYFFTARASWLRRIGHLAVGGAALVIVSASWIGVVALTPAEDRPYIDSSASNSIFDLVLNHNAIQRFVPRERPATAPAMFRVAPPGATRLADPVLASQALWLLPLALAGAAAMVRARRWHPACVWIGWTLAYGIVFSAAGGLFSPYYMVLLGAPLAVLAGVGAVTLISIGRKYPARFAMLLAACLAWQAKIIHPEAVSDTRGLLTIPAVVGVLVACALPLVPIRRLRPAAAMVGVIALSIAPGAWSVSTIAYEGGRPMARLDRTRDPVTRSAGADIRQVRALLPFLRANRANARFMAATPSAWLAAPMIVADGSSAIAFGGFLGSMPVLDGPELAHLVETGALRFAVFGEHGRRPFRTTETDATRWIRAHGTPLDLAAIAPGIGDARLEVFDLRPDLPVVSQN